MEFAQGTPCWMQVDVNDHETGTNFFTNVFGWEIPPGNPELGGYALASIDGKPVSGVWPAANSPIAQPDSIDVWLHVNDIQTALARVEELGALPLEMEDGHIHDVMDLGYQALFTDPVDVITGLWQPKSFIGIEAFSVPGGPCWFEHLSTDPAGAADFYAAAFGLEPTKHSDEYWTLGSPRSNGDSFGTTTPGEFGSPGWLISIYTEDLEESIDLLTRSGGQINGEPFHVEGMGRYCYVTTPGGVQLGLFEMKTA